GKCRGGGERCEAEGSPMGNENREHRHRHAFLRCNCPRELPCLGQAQAHVEPDPYEQGAGQKRNPPAPRDESCLVESLAQQKEGAGGTEKSDRGSQLREHSIPGSLAGRRILGREQDSAAPFATEPESLSEPAQREQGWSEHPERGIAWKDADEQRRH